MAECERIPVCGFFSGDMKKLPDMSETFKRQYCRDKHETCARNKLLLFLEERKPHINKTLEREIERVSLNLSPNEMEKVSFLFTL